MSWIPVSERLPAPGRIVILNVPHEPRQTGVWSNNLGVGGAFGTIGLKRHGGKREGKYAGYTLTLINGVTHWADLPEGP